METHSRPVLATRESQVAALGRALAVERRARYIDFRGKRLTFSQFMRQTADRLCRQYPMDGRWSTIRGLFSLYSNLDVAARISIVRRTEELLFVTGETTDKPSDQPDGGKNKSLKAPPKRPNPAEPNVLAGTDGEMGSRASKPSSKTPSSGTSEVSDAARQESALKLGSDAIVEESARSAEGSSRGTSAGSSVGAFKEQPSAGSNSNQPSVGAKHTRVLQDPELVDIKFIKGVGPKMAEIFQRLEIFTAADLIRHYPRRHLDFQNRLLIRELRPGQEVTVFGTIRSVGAFQAKRSNVSILTVVIGDGTGNVTISRFIGGKSNKYLIDRYKAQFPKGAQVLASGLVERDRYSSRLQLKNAEVEILTELGDAQEEMSSLHTNRLVPVYALTEGLGLRYLRGVIHNALEAYEHAIIDFLPEKIRLQNNLVDLRSALWGIHFPEDIESKDDARKRLVFDELFQIQLHLAHRRYHQANIENALSFAVSAKDGLVEQFCQCLPFKLTGAQQRVFGEIARDLAAPKDMHRLVQGDVGSGKTVVAAMAALVAIENGYQVAVMAPTEILAEQHYRQFQKWLTPLGLRAALFLGKQGAKERRAMQQGLLAGQVHVAVGTHALIQDEVEFAKLGLIVIDEQHRFGVKQRAKLKAKGYNPELLTMTATPIPRTLALTVHGDLDVSEIDELPPGRKPISTKVFTPGDKPKIFAFIREEIKKGRQAYIVFPLIEESELLSAKAATAEYETLKNNVFPEPEFKIGLMHGKLKSADKEAVMEQFRTGELHILVCTTVIEVGVDVPNSSVMLIKNADRFGLAQLHQLRGRVGRGAEQSYCFLVANANNETTRQRLEIMEKTNDGFVVAEKDLELRGPGEFLGTRQSGMPDLLLADLLQDVGILEQARKAAIELIKVDPELNDAPHLQALLRRKAGQTAELVQSG